MNEEQAVAVFIRNTLRNSEAVSALIGTRVFESVAPEGTAYPLVVFNFQGGSDTNALGSDVRTLTRAQWLVKAVTEGDSFATADAIFAALDAALCGAHGPVTVGGLTYQVQTAYRETPIRFPQVSEGVRYNHVGGLYRVPCHRLS